MINVAAAHRTNARELIAFLVGAQEFCIDIMGVREIRVWTPATPVAHAPSFMCGVISLRGVVLPIIDLASARLQRQQLAQQAEHGAELFIAGLQHAGQSLANVGSE